MRKVYTTMMEKNSWVLNFRFEVNFLANTIEIRLCTIAIAYNFIYIRLGQTTLSSNKGEKNIKIILPADP